MPILDIKWFPDPVLKTKAKPVAEVDEDLRQLMNDMLETMYHAPGIGLAANQVGDLRRVIVMDCAGKEEEPQPLKMVNPEILWTAEELRRHEEGCLSVPEQYAELDRPEAVTVRYLDEMGETQELEAEGILATCIQHEIDHLNGVMFFDHLSSLKRNMLLRKFTKWKKEKA